ncbi:uncharacterized protein LOC118262139 [Spodoptera frugiperda]|uniref:Uncharacterized protein LOC118262139 n=1 Tax=Spodoptera frugiperda TaxID=7108 RepID=A0A9R0CTY6_SPOFR|nr:uncharacterized protein LOC118262139 [Spodoptera frugiperda]
MAHSTTIILLLSVFLHIILVNAETLDKKTVEGMLLKMLWTKVYRGHDAETKEHIIRHLKKMGDFDQLVMLLTKVKKKKVERVITLLAEIMQIYME